ncbi:MobA/MobL family protein [Mesorhizobium sp. M1169]|uniref:MobA/MobL family protein n=1 Tax=Mesorhizobium sp. M1169 TaxID=2957066 RepID=UPI0033365F0B
MLDLKKCGNGSAAYCNGKPSWRATWHASERRKRRAPQDFQRLKGRSSVAAAAYRSTSCLTDHRIGATFDYTRKHKIAAFILTPENAPDWTCDREALWNACEFVERANGVVGREVEISIPRDIPESDWQAFAEEICARYVEAGAVVDVAIHAPTAADKNKNPHIHGMLTTRAGCGRAAWIRIH